MNQTSSKPTTITGLHSVQSTEPAGPLLVTIYSARYNDGVCACIAVAGPKAYEQQLSSPIVGFACPTCQIQVHFGNVADLLE